MRSCLLAPTSADVSITRLDQVFNRRPRPSARVYKNTLTAAAPAPIGDTTRPDIALVSQNFNRAKLVLQNNSFATVAGDVAPTMYFGFGSQAVVGQALALPPGVGVVFDVRVDSDAIYVTLGPSINTSSSVVTQGVAFESNIADPETDTANITETGQLGQLIKLLQQMLQGQAK